MPHLFPFPTTLDLSPLVDFWRTLAEDSSSPWRRQAEAVLERVEGVAEFGGPLEDVGRIEPMRDRLEALLGAFVTPADDDLIAAVMVPWTFESVHATPGALELDLPERTVTHLQSMYDAEQMSVGMTMKAYGLILSQVYGIDFGFELPFSWVSFRDVDGTIPIECPATGVTRRFAVEPDPRFVQVDVVGERPEVDADAVAPLAGDPNGLPKLMELLPPENFAFRGVTLLFAEDVTEEAALTAIREELLVKDALTSHEGILRIQEHVRAFLGRSDLELGLIGVEEGTGVDAVGGGNVIGRSLLMSEGQAPVCPHRSRSLYASAVRDGTSVVVDDLATCPYDTGYEHHLRDQGLRAVVVQPLYVEDALVGVLELGSERPGALKGVNVFKLDKLEALFAQGLRRNLAEHEDRIQAIIKQEYTAIHPVVEWRFREAARERLRHGPAAPIEEIVFEGLQPLYGLADIRGSSTLRNAAISADLRKQLELAKGVVCATHARRPQPALGEVEFRLNRYLDSLHPGMATEDESSVLEYLRHQVEPLFGPLAASDDEVQPAVESYRKALDPELGIVYEQRRRFESSVGTVNEIVASALREMQHEAQALVPHYFELFKTDGVDYNVYVGSSLHRDRSHDPLDLGNLRLWQLMAHVRMQWALEAAREEMDMALDVTHLILVQSTPLAIRFRRDERRFDVDGAYNIRYEIVKKRIDKALVRGTKERLTQPGMLAVAYAQEREAAEYRRYIEYLRAEGFVEGELEALEVEDLQGVFGLRALRVRMAPDDSAAQADVDAAAIRAATPRLTLEA